MGHPDPIAFTFFGIDVRWYGILISLGFLIALFISYKRAPRFGLKSDDILDFTIWLIPFSIMGARLYYVIFSWDLYADNPISSLNITNGGLAIHGGLIAGAFVAFFFTKRRKMDILQMADLVLPAVALAQAIGRWGNFFNGEAHGVPTTLPWGILVDGEIVHPTFFYESIWCLLIFLLLTWFSGRRMFRGQIGLLYVILYSTERFFVEGLRTDSLMIGPFRQAQVLSLGAIVLSLLLYILMRKNSKFKI